MPISKHTRREQEPPKGGIFLPIVKSEAQEGSIVTRIFNTTAKFMQEHRRVYDSKPFVVAQCQIMEDGEIVSVDSDKCDGPVFSLHFSGGNPYTSNNVWVAYLTKLQGYESYSLQSVGGLYFEKRYFDTQGRLRELSMVRNTVFIWEAVEAVMFSEDAQERMKRLGSNMNVEDGNVIEDKALPSAP